MIQQISSFAARTKLYHGFGSLTLLGNELAQAKIAKALIVTDQGVRKAGLLEGVEVSLSTSKIEYEVFDEVEEDAGVETMHKGALRAREGACNGVIAVGGGSPICAAKGAALEATNKENVRAFEGVNKYKVPPLPVFCVPTTAGSGADVSWGFVVHDHEKKRQFGVNGDHIQPRVSILDPLLLKTCPPRQMISSGLDALTHAVEALWGARASALTDVLACEAIRLLMTNLRLSALTDNMEAKSIQHLAADMANLACGNALMGIVHAITWYEGLGLPHGYFNGVLLPYGIEYNLPACEDKFARMAVLLGARPYGKSTSELARLFLRRVKELYIDLGFPRRFKPEELPKEKIPEIVKNTMSSFFIGFNVRKVIEEDVTRILEASLKGWELD